MEDFKKADLDGDNKLSEHELLKLLDSKVFQ